MARAARAALLDPAARAIAAAAFAAVLAATGCAVDLGMDADPAAARGREDRSIVNGQATTAFPTTGILLAGVDPASLVCSGTLIGCDRFLTAAHCVCRRNGPACQSTHPGEPLHVFFQHAGFFTVTSVHVHPDYSFPDSDVAVLDLSHPAEGIAPSPLPDAAPGLGQDGIIVGFGRSGGGSDDYGIKQFGSIVTAACPSDADGPGHVCWVFRGGDGANTCNGDSGGPLFIPNRGGGALAVAGTTSGGVRGDCLPGDESYDSEVFAFRDYIVQAAGGARELGQARCGALPHVGQEGVVVQSQQGALEFGGSADYTVEVPPGITELRVGLNSTEGSNPDLFVRAGAAPTASAYDCAENGSSSYGFCAIRSPVPGTWYIQVRATGIGQFQLTTTMFRGEPFAADDSYDVSAVGWLEVDPARGVLANDTPAAGAALSSELDTGPGHGVLDLRPDGSFTYTVDPDYRGSDSFTYRASDGTYASTATVVLAISNSAPGQQNGGGSRANRHDDVAGGCAAGGRAGAPTSAGLLLVLALGMARRLQRARRREARTLNNDA